MRREVDVARPMVHWLKAEQWDVHQEVAIGGGGSIRADIVATMGAAIHVVEVKQSLTLALLEQAANWLPYAHFVSVAVPVGTVYRTGRAFALEACRLLGIGVYEVSVADADSTWQKSDIRVMVQPKMGRKRVSKRASNLLRAQLNDNTRNYAEAGNADSKFWTPFRGTCDQIKSVLKDGPLDTRTLVSRIKHHYSSAASARSTLPKWLALGKIEGVEPVPFSKPLLWRLKESA